MKKLLKPVLVEGLSKRVMLEKRTKLFPFWMVLFLHGDVNNSKLSAIQMLAYFEIPRFKKKLQIWIRIFGNEAYELA